MSIVPVFQLYASNGTTPVYTFPLVQDTNLPKTAKKAIVHQGFRGIGSLVCETGNESFDGTISFIINYSDYEDWCTKIDSLESTIVFNTPYVLSIPKSVSTYYTYNVKRVQDISYDKNMRNGLGKQVVTVTFLVNAW